MIESNSPEPRRNFFGYVIPAPPTFAPRTANANGDRLKGPPTPSCVTKDGSAKYATDGVTQDWFDSHPRPIEETTVEPSATVTVPAKTSQHIFRVTRFPDPDALPDPEWKAMQLPAQPQANPELPPWARPDRRNPSLPYPKGN
jgi:hypothetical protein